MSHSRSSVLESSPPTSNPNRAPVQGYLPPPTSLPSLQNQGQPQSPPAVPHDLQRQLQQSSPTQPPQQPQPLGSFIPQQSRPQSQPQPQTTPPPNMAHGSNPQQVGLTRTPSMQAASQSPASPTNSLHPEIRSVVQLTVAHAHKIYYSGPLVRRLERQPDGQKPHKDDGWVDVWAQLGGTTLSIWDMKEIREASREGKEVPPSYVNVTDAFVQVLGSVTVPSTLTTPSKRYTNVLTLNTAGSNLLLFSCPSTSALISWAAALRLASWEKSRLEEIYTAHLIRITFTARDMPTTLVHGRMEGWARIRIAGQTDWKRVWLSVQEGTEGNDKPVPAKTLAPPSATLKKKRISIFSRDNGQSPLTSKPRIAMFTSPKPKDRKKPLMTMLNVTQAFGVYPERPELISRSTLIKIEGTFGDHDIAANLRLREGWVLIMPELEGTRQAAEMLKWIIALHDAFNLYGRPEAWTWDPRDPISLLFGYPVGPLRDNLFLDREVVEKMDPRDDRTSIIRADFKTFLVNQLKSRPVSPAQTPPTVSPVTEAFSNNIKTLGSSQDPGSPQLSLGPQLPPFSFNAIGTAATSTPNPVQAREKSPTTITERNSFATHERSLSFLGSSSKPTTEQNSRQRQQLSLNMQVQQVIPEETSSPDTPKPPALTLTSTPSTLKVNTEITKPETKAEPHSPTATVLTNPHYSPTSTLLTNPHHSPTQSVFTNPHHSPTISTFSTLPNPNSSIEHSRDLDTFSSSVLANLSSPINATSLATAVPNPAKSEGSTSPSTPVQDSSIPSPVRSSSIANSIQPNVSLEKAHIKPQDMAANQLTKDSVSYESVDDQYHTNLSKHHNRLLLTSTASSQQPQLPSSKSQHDDTNILINEAGAIYYMQQSEAPSANDNANGTFRQQSTQQQKEHSDEDEVEMSTSAPSHIHGSSVGSPVAAANGEVSTSKHSSARRNSTMPGVFDTPSWKSRTSHIGRLSPTRSGLGRKPSGARAQFTPRLYNGGSSQPLTEEEEEDRMSEHEKQDNQATLAYDDEALAVLTYLDIADSEEVSASATPSSPSHHHSPITKDTEPPKFQLSDRPGFVPPTMSNSDSAPFRSSFTPSSKAAERKLKAQAQQAAHEAAIHRPGRANGKKAKATGATGAWESSDDEEEEEEEDEEDDDDVDSDDEVPMMRGLQSTSSQQGFSSSSSARTPQSTSDSNADGPSHLRPPRNLPQIPPYVRADEHSQPQTRRMTAEHQQQYAEPLRRTHLDDGTQIRTQAEFPHPGAARQNIWSQVLEGRPGIGRGQLETTPVRDTFVQLEPAETMTKAFTPQGLLSAGLQDKEDRSAKRQEELARESGGSLVNVPNKPPPPQTGLLGAITAHERERKREGGVGAALTEREREKRVAEERQRKFDEHQRQQLDQMQQGGSMYGGYNPMMANPMMMGMNPMMGINPMMTGAGLNPMMTGGGLNPMMTGGGSMQPINPMMTGQMGFPGMMGGFNPHMFAAQQAAQAYQQAMMAFSVAGSQAGPDGGGGPSQGNPNMNPGMMQGMNPAMTGGMGGFDPRMSMMGMPMMGMGMGMGLPQMGSQMPLGMQMTGMSTFDPRSAPGGGGANSASPSSNVNDGGLLPPTPNTQLSSGTSSPAGRRGSPLARSANMDNAPERERSSSPK